MVASTNVEFILFVILAWPNCKGTGTKTLIMYDHISSSHSSSENKISDQIMLNNKNQKLEHLHTEKNTPGKKITEQQHVKGTEILKLYNNYVDESVFFSAEGKLSEKELLLMDDELFVFKEPDKNKISSLENTRVKRQTVTTTESTNTDDSNTEDTTDDGTGDPTITQTVTPSTGSDTSVISTSTTDTPDTTTETGFTPCNTCTEPPVVDNRPEVNVTDNDGAPCLFLRVNIMILVEYETVHSENKSVHVTVPRDSDTNGSNCHQISMSWSPFDIRQREQSQNNVNLNVNTVTLSFNRNERISISGIHAQILLDNEMFPGAKDLFATIEAYGLSLFEIEEGVLFKCSENNPVEAKIGSIVLSDIEMQGLRPGQNGDNSRVYYCNTTPEDSLALILGIVAGAVALLALIAAATAFTLRRRKRNRTGYHARPAFRDSL